MESIAPLLLPSPLLYSELLFAPVALVFILPSNVSEELAIAFEVRSMLLLLLPTPKSYSFDFLLPVPFVSALPSNMLDESAISFEVLSISFFLLDNPWSTAPPVSSPLFLNSPFLESKIFLADTAAFSTAFTILGSFSEKPFAAFSPAF